MFLPVSGKKELPPRLELAPPLRQALARRGWRRGYRSQLHLSNLIEKVATRWRSASNTTVGEQSNPYASLRSKRSDANPLILTDYQGRAWRRGYRRVGQDYSRQEFSTQRLDSPRPSHGRSRSLGHVAKTGIVSCGERR